MSTSSFDITPRIVSSYRQAFRSKPVRIVARLVKITSSDSAIFDAAGEFNSTLIPVSPIYIIFFSF